MMKIMKKEVAYRSIVFLILFILLLTLSILSGCSSDGSKSNETDVKVADSSTSNASGNVTGSEVEDNITTTGQETTGTDQTSIPEVDPECRDGACNGDENCKTCPDDCPVCTFNYTGNFSMQDIQKDIDKVLKETTILRKDITEKDEAADFFYSEPKTLRYIAEFLDMKYVLLRKSRDAVVIDIKENSYLMDSQEDLFPIINRSRWYLIDKVIQDEKEWYESRLTKESDKTTDIYPSDPSGYLKDQRYDDWEFMNVTSKDDVVINKTEVLDNGLILTTYAGITTYKVTYRFPTSEVKKENLILYDTRVVEEKKLNFINAVSFYCSPNSAVTIYSYSFDTEKSLNPENIADEVESKKYLLINNAKRIQQSCSAKYRTKEFLPNGK